jgi:D-alanyl-D-alanine carboxypeptidase/D-alanyl-D-alanine-endopeptidase (penicillin-binding protein 4)
MNSLISRTLRAAAAGFLFALIPHAVSGTERSATGSTVSERTHQLQQALDEIVARTPLQGARAGIVVASLDSGRVLYARDPDALLNPASNVKLFTSAAVLARLGPEYRFETDVLVDALPSAGMVKSLYVKGRGDPTFVTERLWALAGDIAHRDVKVVKGDILVDDSFFDGEREGPGYDQEKGDRSYLAPVGALSLNFNVVAIHVAAGARVGDKGRVELEPASEYLEVDNRVRTVKATGRRRVTPASFRLPSGRQRITVDARLPLGNRNHVFYRKIDDPPAYFGWTLKRLLELRGVKVTGQVRRAAIPPTARLLTTAESESLGEIVRRLDKTSNNFVAEQLLKTLGAEKKGQPGTWPKGVQAVEDFLADVGIPRGSYVMKNGSGLNDANRFSARQTVTLLREMWRRFPVMADFLAALPVAGKDGTTRWRMDGTEGRLRAKTGTLEGVTSLSGYVETAGFDRLVFSILVNDFPGRAHPTVRAVDAVGSALAAMGGKPAELGAAVASATAPPPGAEEAAADVKAHLATYYRLGRSGDARNVPFLRTALKTEGDPVLRMAAAEAVYLSDPDSESARRAFLDGVATDAASFGRLRTLGAGLEAPAPVLGSLADLAAEGDGEALSRLVQLTAAAMAEPGLADGLADLWEEVARNAPDETIRALRDSPAPAANAALGLMARGLARAQEPHPLLAAVRRAQADPDEVLAAYALALASRLDEQVAAARAVLRAGPAPTIGPAPAPGSIPAPPTAAGSKPQARTGG